METQQNNSMAVVQVSDMGVVVMSFNARIKSHRSTMPVEILYWGF
jgi:hypothetical protein